MNVLQVSRIFEPLLTAQAIAVAKSACSLHEAGAQVEVLCDRSFKCFKAAPWNFPAPYATKRVNVQAYGWNNLLRAFLGHPFFPATPWALEAADVSFPNAFDVVFATFGPVDSLQAALRIAKRTERPLVLEFNDPFPYVLQADLFEDKDRLVRLYRQWYTESWMRMLMPFVGAYVVPSSRMKKSLASYLKRKGRAETPVAVIPHVGWGREGGPVRRGGRKLILSHLGAFYSRKKGGKELFIRCAIPFVKALKRVLDECPQIRDELEVRFVGGLDTPSKEFLSTNDLGRHVVVEPPVDYATSLERMHEADVLLLLEEEMPTSPFLPAKFADYVITRKPILSLSPVESEVGDIMKAGGFGLLANIHSVESIAEQMRRVWQAWKDGVLDDLRVPETVATKFTGKAVGRQYLDVFEAARRD